MKKIITLLLTFMVLTSVLPSVFAQSTLTNVNGATTVSEIPTYTPGDICGDVNNDGFVNVIDIDIIPRVNAGLARWGEGADLTKADVNGNGRVDLGDSGYIARMVSGEVRGMCPTEDDEENDDRCVYNFEKGETVSLISSTTVNGEIKRIEITYVNIDTKNREIKFTNQDGEKIESTYVEPMASSYIGAINCNNSIGKGFLITGDSTFHYDVGNDLKLSIHADISNKITKIKNKKITKTENKNNEISYKRSLLKEKKLIAYNNFINAKENFAKANDKYNNLKKEFVEAKVEAKKVCDNGEESEKCLEMSSKSFEIGRELLLKGTESAIEHLKQIIAKIDASEDVSNEDAKYRLNELNTYINSLVSLKEITENAKTKNELKDAAIKLETLWRLIKFDSKVQTLKLMDDKLEGIYSRAKAVEDKLKCSLDSVNDEKKKEILIKLETYDNLLDDSKEMHKKGVALLNSAITSKSAEQIEESKDIMFESYNIIKKSQGLIISILHEIRNAGGELKDCDNWLKGWECEENYFYINFCFVDGFFML